MGPARAAWMLGWALAWLLGCALQLQQAQLWSAEVLSGLLVGTAALGAWSGWQAWRPTSTTTRIRLHGVVAVLCVAAAAWSSVGLRAHARLEDRLLQSLEGQTLWVQGRVALMPQLSAQGMSLVFEVEQAQDGQGARQRLPHRLWLHWGRGWQEDALVAGPPEAIHAGQRWRLPVRLKRPHGTLNPGGFDGELWLFEQGLGATGQVRLTRTQDAQLLGDDPSPRMRLEAWRQNLRDRLLLRIGDARHAAVIAALAVGDQSAIGTMEWEVFRRTGVAHLISISGLHITAFAWLASMAVAGLWRRWPAACLRCPAPLAGRWGGAALALAYALLAGWGVPAQRTVGMLGLAVLLQHLGVRWPGLLVAVWVAAGASLLDPWALLSPGFWLSFGAVVLLMWSSLPRPTSGQTTASPHLTRLRQMGREAWHTQWVATLGLVPLSVALFSQVSWQGLLANLIAVPWVTWVVTPLCLLGLVLEPLWQLAAWTWAPLAWGLQALADAGGPAWVLPAPSAWGLASACVGVVLGVAPLPWRWRLWGLPWCVGLLWPPGAAPAPGEVRMMALDIGQGTAVWVQTHTHHLLYDSGPALGGDANAGDRVVLPVLHAQGVSHLDMLLLSHQDADHVGGAAAVLAGLHVAALRSSLPPGHALLHQGVPHTACQQGQRWQWDGVVFEVLHPSNTDVPVMEGSGSGAQVLRPNARSCVLRIQDAQGRVLLLTGDIEAPQEQALVTQQAGRLRAQVLVVPHHGSQTSSTDAFLDAVQPRWSVVQAGYLSRYGHPHPQVMARYQAKGLDVVRSDRCGAWVWHADEASCTRVVQARYWHWRDTPAVSRADAPQ